MSFSDQFNNPAGDRQDPAEVKDVDTEVETNDVEGNPAAPTSQEVAPETPESDEPVEVTPADPEPAHLSVGNEEGRVTIGGQEYDVTPDGGRRLVDQGQPYADESAQQDQGSSDES